MTFNIIKIAFQQLIGTEWQIILTCKGLDKNAVDDIVKGIAENKILTCILEWFKKKRSIDANAYFHSLVDSIAKKMNIGKDEAKVKMVLEYGTVMADNKGGIVGFKLPSDVDVSKIYKYTKWFDTRSENGVEFHCYIIYEHTSNLNTSQMAKLIDGTVYEAKELGIETETPEQQSLMLEKWGK